MQVVSGPVGRERVHFEGPEPERVPGEMSAFLDWFNSPPETDGVIRAGMAHLWFVAVPPFEDGNGRIARALTDMALARSQQSPMRLYSVSHRILRERDAYYRALENATRGPATSPPGSAGSPSASAGPWTTPWRRCPWRSRTPP